METVEELKYQLDAIRAQRAEIQGQIGSLYDELNSAPPERRDMIMNRISYLMDLDSQLNMKEQEILAKLEERERGFG